MTETLPHVKLFYKNLLIRLATDRHYDGGGGGWT